MSDIRGNAEGHSMLLRAEPPPGAPLILIVEREAAVQEVLCWMLLLAGYRAIVCADHNVALTWGEQINPVEDPALILLDLSLPSAIGAADFLARLRARWQEAGKMLPPIIVLTTSPPVRAELEPRECLLLKPFHVRDLLSLIQGLAPALT